MFWRFGFQAAASTLDTLLEQEPAPPLDQVLLEEDLLQECKTRNQKLLQYLSRPQCLQELVGYVTGKSKHTTAVLQTAAPVDVARVSSDGGTTTPSVTVASAGTHTPLTDHATKLQSVKLSFLSAEVLCCEGVCEQIVKSTELLQELWSFLNRSPPLEPVTCSYFTKVVGFLLMRFTKEVFENIKLLPNLVSDLLKHIETSTIADLLLKLVAAEDQLGGNEIATWLQSHGLVRRLIDKLNPTLSTESHAAAANVLVELVTVCHQSSKPDADAVNSNIFVKELKGRTSVTLLLKYMLPEMEDHISASSLMQGAGILTELIRRGSIAKEEESSPPPAEIAEALVLHMPPPPPPAIKRDPLEISELVSVVTENIGRLVQLLRNPVWPLPLQQTTMGSIAPLGVERLMLSKLILDLLRRNEAAIYDKFHQHRALVLMFDLFFQFPWNSMLHSIVCDALEIVCEAGEDAHAEQIIASLFTEVEILKRIAQAQRLNDYQFSRPKGLRLGYMGHIVVIADHLQSLMTKNLSSSLREITQPRIQSEEWQDFITRPYRDAKNVGSKVLGGEKPVLLDIHPSPATEDHLDMHVDQETDQLARYLIQQLMNDLPDKFTVEEFSMDDGGWAEFGPDYTFELQGDAMNENDETGRASMSEDEEEEESDDEDEAPKLVPSAAAVSNPTPGSETVWPSKDDSPPASPAAFETATTDFFANISLPSTAPAGASNGGSVGSFASTIEFLESGAEKKTSGTDPSVMTTFGSGGSSGNNNEDFADFSFFDKLNVAAGSADGEKQGNASEWGDPSKSMN